MTETSGDGLSVYLDGGVVIPPRLNRALEEDRLVLFVGAGASRDPGSSLPDFKGLTEGLLKLAGSTVALRDDERFDLQLGDLADTGFSVHEGIRQIIGDPKSIPNRWHEAICSLFGSPGKARIVTTNYDLHLETALGSSVEVWRAPALPLGDSFRGVVHLHGSIDGGDAGYVATDSEFGRAYMTEGWARRFLVSVLRDFEVLFLGYSHNDLVMQYLARGLPQERPPRRWALVGPNDTQQWDRYRIEALAWASDPADKYGPGVLALTDWGDRTWWTPQQQEKRIKDLVAGGPLLDPVDENYLSRAIGHETRVSFFCMNAKGAPWLKWAQKQDQFLELFDPEADLSPAQRRLAYWFADVYIVQDVGDPLGVLADAGGELSKDLWRAVARALWSPNSPFIGDWTAWLAVLVTSQHKHADHHILNYIFKELQLPQQREAFLLLLRTLFEPIVRVRPGLSLPGSRPQISVDLKVIADQYWVEEALKGQILPNIATIDSDTYHLATSLLTEYHHIYAGAEQNPGPFDPLNFQRSAIEPHSQNRYNDTSLMLVDIARESAVSLTRHVPALELARDLMSRGTPLLQRLAAWIVARA